MSFKYILFLLTIAAAFLISPVFGMENEAGFPRHPSLSPDGSELAFCHAGDIWKVASSGGAATILTTSPAHDHSPRWSPDGNWIAFNSSRNGDEDVYVMPAAGGNSKRLTFSERDDDICSWAPDSESILFTSRRNHRYPNYRMLYSIQLGGGMPQPVLNYFANRGSYSAAQDKVLYTRNGVSWWRKGYRGSGAGSAWIYDISTNEHKYISTPDNPQYGADFQQPQVDWPMWGADNSIYVVAEWDGTYNLYKSTNSVDDWHQITHFQDDGVRFPSISNDRSMIAFEQATNIYTLTNDSLISLVNIIAPTENHSKILERIEYSDNADRVGFSPSGEQIIVEVRGEIFAGWITGKKHKEARGEANSLTRDNTARDGDFDLTPGGDSLVFVSDRDGNRNLYLTHSDNDKLRKLAQTRKLVTKKLISSDQDDHSPKCSPDGKSIAFIRGKGDLYIYDLKKQKTTILLSGWSMNNHCWSPDSKWLAFSREDNNYNSDIFVMRVKDGAMTNISRHPDEDVFPVWSDDGKKLGFISRRRSNNWDIYFVYLNEEDHYKGSKDRAEEVFYKSMDENDDEKGDKKKDKKKQPEKEVIVKIDTLDIHSRIRNVIVLSGEEGKIDISPDGEKFAFTSDIDGENDIYIVDWTGKNLKKLTEGNVAPRWLGFDQKGNNIRYITSNGSVKSLSIEGGTVKSIPFKAVLWVDPLAEREQKFNEMWRWLNERYYDAEFHGADWQALHDKYEPLLDLASTEEDFGDIANMMIGEINSSHSGYRTPRLEDQHSVGRLGLDFKFSDDGEGLLISHVLKNGACDRNGVYLKPGDRLLAVNGTAIDKRTNLNQLMDYLVNKKVELTIEVEGIKSTVLVRSQSHGAEGRIRYKEWVSSKRMVVDSLSNHRLGYIHIKGMGAGSLANFESELFSVAEGKDALVIDVRYNGGGWTTDYLLAMLQVERHAVTFPRDGGAGYPQGRLPLYSWVKPIIVLCNEHSFSNAEIFSHAIKTLQRGTLVGVPTPGGVISTGWHGLLDGSGFRVPLRGWYAGADPKKEQHRNMEGNGALPDIFVPMKPGQMESGDDIQLITAINELLDQLKE